jgi:hypothetical protein
MPLQITVKFGVAMKPGDHPTSFRLYGGDDERVGMLATLGRRNSLHRVYLDDYQPRDGSSDQRGLASEGVPNQSG